jgi:hypothetical protein
MKKPEFEVGFISKGRKAQCDPNPAFPEGVDVDLSGGRFAACTVEVPYPAEFCGTWVILCARCGYRCAVTAAGRADDPRSVTMPCKTEGK